MDLEHIIEQKAIEAKAASRVLSNSSLAQRNKALLLMAEQIKKNSGFILSENKKDIAQASKAGLSKAMIDRLTLNAKRLNDMAVSIKAVSRLDDPCGVIDKMWKRPNGLIIGKMRVPIGVIGII